MSDVNIYFKEAFKNGFVLTKFLDTTEFSLINKNNLIIPYYYGGYENAERVRVILTTDENTISKSEFEITCLKIECSKIKEITHRHVLGTVLSLGIKREMIGDIVFDENSIYLFVVKEMSNYIITNLIKINNLYVDVKEISNEEIDIKEKEEIKVINVASLRLDAVIAHTLNISRTKAVEMIMKGLIQINHLETDNISYNLKNDDLISVRHFGRIKIVQIEGVTKKNRLRVKISVKH